MKRGAIDFMSAPVLAADKLGAPTTVNADGPVHRHHHYALPPVTREVRAANAKVYLNTRFSAKQQVFLDFVLSHYVNVGVEELDKQKLTPLLVLKYTISDALAELGRPEEIGMAFTGFQNAFM